MKSDIENQIKDDVLLRYKSIKGRTPKKENMSIVVYEDCECESNNNPLGKCIDIETKSSTFYYDVYCFYCHLHLD